MSTIKHPTGLPTDREGLAYWLTTNLRVQAGTGCRWLDSDEVADWHLAEIEKAKKQRTEECAEVARWQLGPIGVTPSEIRRVSNAILDLNNPKPVWCDHMTFMESSTQTSGWMVNDGPGSWWMPRASKFCPICGKRNPNIPEQEGK